MISVDRFNELKKSADDARRAAAQAEGAQRQLMQQLADEFDCQTLETAERKAAKLEKEAKAAERRAEELLAEFEETWWEKLKAL